MKVAVHNDGPELRGSEKQLLLIVRGLAGRNHDVAVSCRAGSAVAAALAQMGIRTTTVRPRGDVDLFSAMRFSRWLARERPGALLLTSWKRVPVAVVAARVARVPRIVLRLGLVRPLGRSGARLLRYRTAFRHVDALILNSPDAADAWTGSAPWFPRERVHVVNNAIDPARAAPIDRRSIGVPAEANLLLSAAGLEKRKGIGTLLEAVAKLPPTVHAAIAGSGQEEEALRARAVELDIQDRIHWLGFRDDVPALMATADAFVLPSLHDSFASSILEAMVAGLPIVTTTGSGVSHVLGPTEDGSGGHGPGAHGPGNHGLGNHGPGNHGHAGWLVEPGSPDALVDAIEEALSSDGAVRGAEARRRACEWFDVERMIDRYESILQGPV